MASVFDKEIARSIRQSMGRFAAIAVISLLGAGFFAGLRLAAPDMRLAGDEYFDGTALFDVSLVSTVGFDEESVEMLEGIEGVDEVMASRQADALVSFGGESHAARIESLPMESARGSDTSSGVGALYEGRGYLNRPVLVSGAWPADASQCVVGARSAEALGLEVGMRLELGREGGQSADEFALREFVVSGLVSSPLYASSSMLGSTELGTGEIELYVFVEPSAFSEDYPVSVLYAKCAQAEGETWAHEGYDRAVEQVVRRVDQRADAIADARLASVKSQAQESLDESRADFERQREEALAGLDEAAFALDEAHGRLEQAKAELDSGRAGLDRAAAELASAKGDLDAGEAEYADGTAALEARRAQVEQGYAQLDQLKAALLDPNLTDDQRLALENQVAQIEQGVAAIADAERRLAAARAKLDAGWREYEAGRDEYRRGWADYERGLAEYRQGLASYESAEADFESGKADAEREFADAERRLAEGQRDIDDIEPGDVYVMDRSKNVGAASLSSDAEGIAQIATFLPFMFFLVAALVSLTSMTRMVDEERLEIGTHKALGYRPARITSKYLIYGAAASGVGSVAGVFSLGKLLPWFILTSYQVSYDVPTLPLPIDPAIAFAAVALSIGVTLVATWASAASSLRESPAALMLPRPPKAGKRIFLERIGPLWSRLSFSRKVTARNLLRYKKRFLMAVVGVAGCTALLMIGFGLRDAIGGIVSNQYGELVRYDAIVRISDEAGDAERAAIEDEAAALSDECIWVDEFDMIAEGPDADVRIEVVVVSEDDRFPSFVSLHERPDGPEFSLSDGRAVLSEKAARVLGVNAGDSIELFDENLIGDAVGNPRAFEVGGVAENYLGHYAYLSEEGYRKAFGSFPEYDAIYAKLGDGADREMFSEALRSVPGVATVSFVSDAVETYEDMLDVMNKLILVIVALSAALAFVVLYNLTNINIGERVREIATLKVLGFTKREVNSYIFREIIVMAFIGAIAGCVIGVPLTFYIAEAAETANMMFGRDLAPESFVLSFVITLLFSAVVAFTMRGKLARVDMVESLKSIE